MKAGASAAGLSASPAVMPGGMKAGIPGSGAAIGARASFVGSPVKFGNGRFAVRLCVGRTARARRRGRVQRIAGECFPQRTVRIDRPGDDRFHVEIADLAELVAHLAQVRLADHLVHMGLELGRHAARLLERPGDRPDRHRHVLGADRQQRDDGDNGELGPCKIEHRAGS